MISNHSSRQRKEILQSALSCEGVKVGEFVTN